MNGKTVQAYSLTADGSRYISGNFQVREFRSRDSADVIFIDPELVQILQKIRNHFGRAVNVNSAYRTISHNMAVGGAADSQHLYGTAADIVIRGISPKTVAAYAETLLPNRGGIGVYAWGIHVDTRREKARWKE